MQLIFWSRIPFAPPPSPTARGILRACDCSSAYRTIFLCVSFCVSYGAPQVRKLTEHRRYSYRSTRLSSSSLATPTGLIRRSRTILANVAEITTALPVPSSPAAFSHTLFPRSPAALPWFPTPVRSLGYLRSLLPPAHLLSSQSVPTVRVGQFVLFSEKWHHPPHVNMMC